MPGAVIVALEMVPSLSLYGLQPLACAAAQVARAACLHGLATSLTDNSTLTQAGKDLAAVMGHSLDMAIYT